MAKVTENTAVETIGGADGPTAIFIAPVAESKETVSAETTGTEAAATETTGTETAAETTGAETTDAEDTKTTETTETVGIAENLTGSVKILGQGMASIFVVLGIIAVFVSMLKKLDNKKKK